jgi:hypothetical protein
MPEIEVGERFEIIEGVCGDWVASSVGDIAS